MKTFAAVSVESTITHVTTHSDNTLNNVVTTIAAHVNPPYTTADVLTSSVSAHEDVFKSSNLDEEDLQDGRVTLPLSRQYKVRKSPSPPPVISPETPSPPPPMGFGEDQLPSAPSLEIIELSPVPSSTGSNHVGSKSNNVSRAAAA